MIVNVHEAETNLSLLLEGVAAGEEIVIGRAGPPVARLVPYREPGTARTPGALRGSLWVADDFDGTPPSVLDAFEGWRLSL